MTALGVALRMLREGRGLSLRELAALCDVDHAYLHRLETGAMHSPGEDVLSRLLRALKAAPRQAAVVRAAARNPDVNPSQIARAMTMVTCAAGDV